MTDKKVLLITKVDAVWNRLDEFHEYWERKNLPFWIEHGAKHIGSYVNYLGGQKNQIVRLFEFDDLPHFNRFMELRESMFDSEPGRAAMEKLFPFLETIEETVWVSAYEPD